MKFSRLCFSLKMILCELDYGKPLVLSGCVSILSLNLVKEEVRSRILRLII